MSFKGPMSWATRTLIDKTTDADCKNLANQILIRGLSGSFDAAYMKLYEENIALKKLAFASEANHILASEAKQKIVRPTFVAPVGPWGNASSFASTHVFGEKFVFPTPVQGNHGDASSFASTQVFGGTLNQEDSGNVSLFASTQVPKFTPVGPWGETSSFASTPNPREIPKPVQENIGSFVPTNIFGVKSIAPKFILLKTPGTLFKFEYSFLSFEEIHFLQKRNTWNEQCGFETKKMEKTDLPFLFQIITKLDGKEVPLSTVSDPETHLIAIKYTCEFIEPKRASKKSVARVPLVVVSTLSDYEPKASTPVVVRAEQSTPANVVSTFASETSTPANVVSTLSDYEPKASTFMSDA